MSLFRVNDTFQKNREDERSNNLIRSGPTTITPYLFLSYFSINVFAYWLAHTSETTKGTYMDGLQAQEPYTAHMQGATWNYLFRTLSPINLSPP